MTSQIDRGRHDEVIHRALWRRKVIISLLAASLLFFSDFRHLFAQPQSALIGTAIPHDYVDSAGKLLEYKLPYARSFMTCFDDRYPQPFGTSSSFASNCPYQVHDRDGVVRMRRELRGCRVAGRAVWVSSKDTKISVPNAIHITCEDWLIQSNVTEPKQIVLWMAESMKGSQVVSRYLLRLDQKWRPNNTYSLEFIGIAPAAARPDN